MTEDLAAGRVPWESFRLSPGFWEAAGTEEGMARMGELMSQLPVMSLEELMAMTMESNEPNGDHYVPVETEDEGKLAVQKIVENHEKDQVPDTSFKLTTHTIHYESPAGNTSPLPAAICTCGKSKHHAKFKKVHQWAEKHESETGHMMLRGQNESQ